jgi:hypothetical protein
MAIFFVRTICARRKKLIGGGHMKQDQKIKRGIALAVVVAPVAVGFGAACSAGGGNSEGPGGGVAATNNQGGNAGVVFGMGGTNTSGTAGQGAAPFNPGVGGTNVGGNQNTGGFVGNTATAPLPPQVDRCMGQAAQFGTGSGAGLTYTYPYEGTIFPRGLLAPGIMWNQNGSADSVMLKLQSQGFTYQECFPAANPTRIAIPQDAWDSAGFYSGGPSDPLTVTLTVVSGGQVLGPVTETIMFAQAAIKGAIYYNTYDSPLAQNNGAILKISPGQAQPTPFLTVQGVPPLGPCVSCHALSVNGSVMLANTHLYPTGPFVSASYDVTGPAATQVFNNLPEAGFAGVFPDGSLAMTNGLPNTPSRSYAFPDIAGAPPALISFPNHATSHLLDTRTGTAVQAPGWDVQHATMPMFSPDGKHIVYNDFDQGGGHSLWMMDFDVGTRTFSGKRQIFNDPTRYAGWPFFTPDSKQVLFVLTTRDDFASQVPDFTLPVVAPNQPAGNGYLMLLDLASNQAVKLDLAGGFRNGQSYLPGNDNDREFYPTMSPIAAGGFFWAFFTARRTIGNLQTLSVEDPKSKKLWVTAISMGAPPGTDPSHPAFVLPGQELGTGNMRAFAALEPCKEDGEQCTAGTDCCRGYCGDIKSDTGIGICGAQPPNECAKEFDKCTQDSDCCPPAPGTRALVCIGGFCAQGGIR